MIPNRIQPLIIGRGAAGQALSHALAMFPDRIAPAVWLERGHPLPPPEDPDTSLLVVANPHGLHTPRLLEGAELGYRFAICEKPTAVDLDQMEALGNLPTETWVCHGYRMLWGPQELRKALASGRFGELISIEGRYWQSSATRAVTKASWKDDTELGGRFDVLLDLATHWADLVTSVCGRLPERTAIRRSFVNAESPHRDTHVHLMMDFGRFTSFGSVSKTMHGAGNTLELIIVGEKASAIWTFERPDVIVWGSEGTQSTQTRSGLDLPSRPAPFHGLGWMEGYARIVGEVATRMQSGEPARAPTLEEHLDVLGFLLRAAETETNIKTARK